MSRIPRRSARFMKPRLQQLHEHASRGRRCSRPGLDARRRNRQGPRQAGNESSSLRDAIIEECFKRGLLVLGAGASTIRLSPPLDDRRRAGRLRRATFFPKHFGRYGSKPCRFCDLVVPAHSIRPPFRNRRRRLSAIPGFRVVASGYRTQSRRSRSDRLGRQDVWSSSK